MYMALEILLDNAKQLESVLRGLLQFLGKNLLLKIEI